MTPQEDRTKPEVESGNTDCDDMFGPPRVAPVPRPRLTMITTRLRVNEERKRVIQICSQKVHTIDDPLSDMRRSVCINNTFYRLTEEVRKEKEARRAGRRKREPCEDTWTDKRMRRAVEFE